MQSDPVDRAVNILRKGGLVAYPTETFYGIAAWVHCERALRRLSRIKGRPVDSPFPLLIPDVHSLWELVSVEAPRELIQQLAKAFWPGPLTLVLPARETLSRQLVGPDGGVAMRVSSHPLAARLTQGVGGPITATSANFRGQPPPSDPEAIRRSGLAQRLDLLLDGGPTGGQNPSTLLRLEQKQATILRPGALHAELLASVLASLNVELR
ncbi:MAG: threonylcarbamoyl-AMP synthase [Bradymonadales bacterium]|nr:threonylcarbamoyl-AMP synthase [Bradymonadales bacterium]